MRGYDGLSRVTLVRNPDYDPQTDSPAARESFPDRFEFTVDNNGADIVDRVAAGELEDENAVGLPPAELERYATDPAKRARLHLDSADRTRYLAMNVTQPPFDDVHVRRAMNWILDKASLRQAWGGPLLGRIAHHIVPDSIFHDELAAYDPYRTAGDRGSVAKARRAMRGSKYDLAHDGMCSAAACHHVFLLTSTRTPAYLQILPIVEADAKKIGITFEPRAMEDAPAVLGTTAKNIPIATFTAWAKDYPDAVTFLSPLFDGRTIIPVGNTNVSLVGLDPSQAGKLGLRGSTTNVPSVNADLDRCAARSGQSRRTCYERLDKVLMTKAVPWVPYLQANVAHITGPHVTQWRFDQFSAATAYAHVAVS